MADWTTKTDAATSLANSQDQWTDAQRLAWYSPGGGGYDANSQWSPEQRAAWFGSGGGATQPSSTSVSTTSATSTAPPPPPPSGSPGDAPGTNVAALANQALQTPTTVGAQPAQGSQATVAGAFQQALVNQLAPGPISAQSPEIAPAIAANKATEQRMMERQRAQLAEQAAQQGLDQNAFGSQLRGLTSESALRQGQFSGNAVANLATQRAQQIMAALSLSGGMLGDQDRMALSRELANLQAQLQREGLSLQSSLGNQDLSLRRDLGEGQLNLGLLGNLLSNQQYGQGLSASTALGTAGLNQQALLGLMGMV